MELFDCSILKKIIFKSPIVFFICNFDEILTFLDISANISEYGYSKKSIFENSFGFRDFLVEKEFDFIKKAVNDNFLSINRDFTEAKEISNIKHDCHFKKNDNSNCWIRVEFNVGFDEFDDKNYKLGGVFFDITNEKNLLENYSNSQKMEALGRLASGVAHEINTPMQYIQDNSFFLGETFIKLFELINRLNLNSQITEKELSDLKFYEDEIPLAIEDIATGISSVKNIIGAMREFAHTGDDIKSPQDINRAIESCKTIMKNQWKYVSDLILNLDNTIPLIICNINQINQVLINLIMNSIDAIKEVFSENGNQKGVIYISTSKKDEYVEITIDDSGKGISLEIRNKILEPFFTTKEVGKGTGQGLPISYDIIVNKHKGEFILNTPKSGTSFTIRLPI